MTGLAPAIRAGAPAAATAFPARYRIAERHGETHDTVTLVLQPVDEPIAAYLPGQFTMLYAFGVGEVPISISGDPARAGLIQTIRAVGAVTTALCQAAPGQLVGVRGPYGTDWGVPRAAGHDLVIVAGGIGLAPLRSAVLTALAAPGASRRILILIGARSPGELVFAAELDNWRSHGAEVHVTVDRADSGWTGQVGLVTQLIDQADLDPARTTALVCGPELMMRLSAEALCAQGIAPDRVRVSLERNMHCGMAECGHCQLGPLLLCRDGPVIGYDQAASLLAIREL